jgi:hypothetical protein
MTAARSVKVHAGTVRKNEGMNLCKVDGISLPAADCQAPQCNELLANEIDCSRSQPRAAGCWNGYSK